MSFSCLTPLSLRNKFSPTVAASLRAAHVVHMSKSHSLQRHAMWFLILVLHRSHQWRATPLEVGGVGVREGRQPPTLAPDDSLCP